MCGGWCMVGGWQLTHERDGERSASACTRRHQALALAPVWVDPRKSELVFRVLKLKHDEPLSSFPPNFNSRLYRTTAAFCS
jgi:hypothetical protein